MHRVKTEEYLTRIREQSPIDVIGTAVHTIGNRTNTIMGAADMLKIYLLDEEDEDSIPKEKIEKFLEMIANNSQDIANVLDALGQYTIDQTR